MYGFGTKGAHNVEMAYFYGIMSRYMESSAQPELVRKLDKITREQLR